MPEVAFKVPPELAAKHYAHLSGCLSPPILARNTATRCRVVLERIKIREKRPNRYVTVCRSQVKSLDPRPFNFEVLLSGRSARHRKRDYEGAQSTADPKLWR
jgi:hypothetical protein